MSNDNMKVLVFGGRNFNDKNHMMNTFNDFYYRNGPITVIIHGAAKGADLLGQHFAKNWLGVPDISFPADWKNIDVQGAVVKQGKYGPYNAIAGHQRNQRMIDKGKPDWGIMFHGGKGTTDMNKRLIKACIPVWDATK